MKTKLTQIAATSADEFKMPMRIVVMNYVGGVGKTTIVRHVIMPALPGAELIRVESTNSSGTSEADYQVTGREFEAVARRLYDADVDTVVDIGSSNADEVRHALHTLGEAHHNVDLWVVPSIQSEPDCRIVTDTIATIKELILIGVEPSKIAVVKNNVKTINTMDRDFSVLQSVTEALGVRMIDTPILSLKVFPDMDDKLGTFEDIAGDRTDFRRANLVAKAAGDVQAGKLAVDAEFRRMMARGGVKMLQAVRLELLGFDKSITLAAVA